jgi:hypothetical protein
VDFNPATNKIGDVTAIVEYQQNAHNGLKAKINDKLNLSFVLKRIHTSQLSLSLGASVPIGSTANQTSKVGIQVDLNI